MTKQKVWKEIESMPEHIAPEDKLLFQGHMFVKKDIWNNLKEKTRC